MPPPPPPPSLSLGVLIIRKAVALVLGLPAENSSNASPSYLPPVITHRSVPGTAKIGVSLGKKTSALPAGCGIVQVEASDDFKAAFLQAVEDTANALIATSSTVTYYALKRKQHEAAFGKRGYDDGNNGLVDPKKKKKKKKPKKDADGKEIVEPEVSRDGCGVKIRVEEPRFRGVRV